MGWKGERTRTQTEKLSGRELGRRFEWRSSVLVDDAHLVGNLLTRHHELKINKLTLREKKGMGESERADWGRKRPNRRSACMGEVKRKTGLRKRLSKREWQFRNRTKKGNKSSRIGKMIKNELIFKGEKLKGGKRWKVRKGTKASDPVRRGWSNFKAM